MLMPDTCEGLPADLEVTASVRAQARRACMRQGRPGAPFVSSTAPRTGCPGLPSLRREGFFQPERLTEDMEDGRFSDILLLGEHPSDSLLLQRWKSAPARTGVTVQVGICAVVPHPCDFRRR